ncbi:electron transfer flavoprotein subunit beta/FixA family protein [Clostridium sp. DL1XJH146]
MKIAVCIKQVPASCEIEMDKETGVLKREGKETRINPHDLSAIEAALEIKEKYGGKISAFTMGPRASREVIVYSYSMGVDEGYHLSDTKFAGADVFSTSFTLAEGIRLIDDFDLIICGRQTTDGDTGQVGPAIAEHLKLPHIHLVSAIDKIQDKNIFVTQQLDNKEIKIKVSMPCVLIVQGEAFKPRLPSLKLKLKAKKKEINKITIDDMRDNNPEKYGLRGAPTRVRKIFLPEKTSRQEILTGDSSYISSEIMKIFEKQKMR